jgi:hypothetical protein
MKTTTAMKCEILKNSYPKLLISQLAASMGFELEYLYLPDGAVRNKGKPRLTDKGYYACPVK